MVVEGFCHLQVFSLHSFDPIISKCRIKLLIIRNVMFQMFVGQVPRSMDENDLRLMFEEFGRVHQINVLRDKITGASKGSFFLHNLIF